MILWTLECAAAMKIEHIIEKTANKSILSIVNKFLCISEFAYEGVFDVLFPEWNREKEEKKKEREEEKKEKEKKKEKKILISFALKDETFDAAKRVVSGMIEDGNITTNGIVDTLTYKYIYSIDKLDKLIHGKEYTVKCLEVCAFNVVFRLFVKGSRMMDMLFAHNYVGLRNSPDGLPTLFIIGEKSPLKIMDIIKDYSDGVFRLSDIAENWCCAASGPNAYGWKEPKDGKMKKANHKYLHNYKRKETNYEQLKTAHRTFDHISFYQELVPTLAKLYERGITLRSGYTCRYVTLGELRAIGLLDAFLPDLTLDMYGQKFKNMDDQFAAIREVEKKRKEDVTDVISCKLCKRDYPFQYMKDSGTVIIIGAEIFHDSCLGHVFEKEKKIEMPSASIWVENSLSHMDSPCKSRYTEVGGEKLESVGIVDVETDRWEIKPYNDIYEKRVFRNELLKNGGAKVFGGFIRRYLSAKKGFEFKEIALSGSDVDIITVTDVWPLFKSAWDMFSPKDSSAVLDNAVLQHNRNSSFADSNTGFIYTDNIVLDNEKTTRKFKMDIHMEDDFQEPKRSYYTTDAFPNMLTLDIASGDVSIMRQYEIDDLRMEQLSRLETLSIAISAAAEHVYLLNQGIPQRPKRMNPNHLRRLYKPLEMSDAGWHVDFTYVKWKISAQKRFEGITNGTTYAYYNVDKGDFMNMSVFVNSPSEVAQCIYCEISNCVIPHVGGFVRSFEGILDTLLHLECGHEICLRCLYFGKELNKEIIKYDYYDVTFDGCKQIMFDVNRGRSDDKDSECHLEHTEPCKKAGCYHFDGCSSAKKPRLRLICD